MRNALWIIIAIIIVGGGIWWWTMSDNANMTDITATINENAASPAPGAETAPETPAAATSATVTYNGTAYFPSSVTIKKGGTVTFKNESSGNMWVASAQHPTHTVYDETSRTTHCAAGYTGAKPFDQCVGGSEYSFTFEKIGQNGYHDHINTSAFGSITVVE